jgi:hypothetical protein
MRKVRLLTMEGRVQRFNVKSLEERIYIPKFKAYVKFDDEMARALRSGLEVRVARGRFVTERNVSASLIRFEKRKEIQGLGRSMKAIRHNLTVKRPPMLSARIESAVFSLSMSRGHKRAESLVRLREFFKAKKRAISTGKPLPKAEDYLY